ncbi:exodeoxyribonuclease-1 [Comamonas sp. BIGb0152]|uniref:exodeoxyribonuclease I n=1 Tax=Comamonas sp. BIGb0152 TaxID=2940601 RepID=UPI002169EC59|nr:exodeoxyribonuclease I [Comamonas sp. BIGb0152]MCS4293159.1 exodeoxyribonuclease-1 [Comamonas sp. BIGb0152]
MQNSLSAPASFFWHDYETFGAVPRQDRPAQFAGIRTDMDLNEIGEPVMRYCQPALDYLPSPQASLITSLTPQHCLEQGVPEHQFAAAVEAELGRPGTIGVGYNTIRFDDEVTRYMLWRNLRDPYAREWQNGCGRWDLLDVVRMVYALRPEGIQWPQKEDGSVSFKLEDLARANGILHESAHDALSDVRATIGLARLIKRLQPRLFDFALGLHKKDRVMQELALPATSANARPFLHVSGMYGVERGCIAVVWPLAQHPTNKNEIIAWDLAQDPSQLAELSVDDMRLRMFSATADLPEGTTRLPIKTVHLNKSPMVVSSLRTLSAEQAARWKIDMEQAMRHAAIARDLPDMSATWAAVFQRPPLQGVDVDQDLYGGFIGQADRRRLNQLIDMHPQELAVAKPGFDDARLHELLFRYRARNFPDSLNPEEQQRWQALRIAFLHEGLGGARTAEQMFAEIDQLSETADERAEEILGTLYDWADAIMPDA